MNAPPPIFTCTIFLHRRGHSLTLSRQQVINLFDAANLDRGMRHLVEGGGSEVEEYTLKDVDCVVRIQGPLSTSDDITLCY